jgi:hypothetical protein
MPNCSPSFDVLSLLQPKLEEVENYPPADTSKLVSTRPSDLHQLPQELYGDKPAKVGRLLTVILFQKG